MDNELLAFYIVAKPEKRSFEEMSSSENIAVVLEAFRAVERRDRERLNALYHPEVEFHFPPALPLPISGFMTRSKSGCGPAGSGFNSNMAPVASPT